MNASALGLLGTVSVALAFVVTAGLSTVLSLIDIESHLLPNRLVLSGLAAVLGLLGVAALSPGGDARRFLGAVGGSLALGLAYWALHLLHPAGLGLGDVKYAALLGLPAGWLGAESVWLAGALPFVAGGFVALVALAARRADRHSSLAFGPFMFVGSVAAWALAWLAA